MTKYRFKFSKGEEVKFTGHLDVMQAFQRAIKRAVLPISYSQGFNPHQNISFALPLSLGYTSEGEYGDFKLASPVEPEIIMKALNETMVDGLKITQVVCLKEGVKNTMSSVAAARYKVFFSENVTPEHIEKNIDEFFKQEEINVMKKTKKGIKEANIRPDIIKLFNLSQGNKGILGMEVYAGSVRNLKPESVAEGFCNFIGKEYNKFKMSFSREDMFMEKDGEYVPLTFGVEDK